MPYEHKPGTFSLFKNDKKESDNHPDYRGTGKDLDGEPIEVAAWIKAGNKGKFMSCTFKPARSGGTRPANNRPAQDDDDSQPF